MGLDVRADGLIVQELKGRDVGRIVVDQRLAVPTVLYSLGSVISKSAINCAKLDRDEGR